MPKNKDILLIALVVVLALAMLGVSRLMPKADISTKVADATLAPDAIEYVATPEPTAAPTSAPTAKPTSEPAAEPGVEATAAPTAEPTAEPTSEPATESTAEPASEPAAVPAAFGPMPPKRTETVRGHVVLTVGGRQYGDPVPMDRDKIITLRQEDGKINKVHITPETVYMESSTCDNQDCVQQGEVHVDTYKDRILGTFVICLPNNVSIEMIPAE